jgi:predicted HicB family RNase H-like nuclease
MSKLVCYYVIIERGDRKMKIKTFPLKFVEEELKKISDKARKMNMSTNQFILEAIKEKMEKNI